MVEGGHDAIADAPLLGLRGADRTYFLAHEQVGGGRETGREAEATSQQVADGAQVNLVGLVEREGGLNAVELDLVGVDEVVEERGAGPALQVVGVADHQIASPAFVVHAGGLMAEDDQLGLVLGH